MGESNYPLKIFLLLMPNELMYVENLDMCEREVGSLFLTSTGAPSFIQLSSELKRLRFL